MKISIAMATYNGERFLSEQLESIRYQEILPFELVINDDRSTDSTMKILEKFAKTAPFRVEIVRNEEQVGWLENFFRAARRCNGDWISFCDQDDVWFKSKLSDCANIIGNNKNLNLILQKAIICDENLNHSNRIFPDFLKSKLYHKNDIYGFWVWLGFLQTVRADLFKTLNTTNRPKNYFPDHEIQSHDKWTCMIANALGGVIVVDNPAAYYRRHQSALTGFYEQQSIKGRIGQSLKTKSEHYLFESAVALQSSEYLLSLSQLSNNDAWNHDFIKSSKLFKILSDSKKYRYKLYRSNNFIERFYIYIRMHMNGYYFGHPFYRMGLSSALKDSARLVLGGF